MEKISYDEILEIQKKVNIVDIISEYLPIEKKGKNYFAICPFHDDHNPSMSISPEKQIYTCFVCGASGNVFNFVANYEKISFYEAVSKVASKAGININLNYQNNIKKIDNKNDKYYKIYDVANKYYQNNINTSYGKKAKEYLIERKIDDEIIKTFGIGLSLNDNSLSKILISKKIEKEDIVELGLCSLNQNEFYDTFKNRIMFPLQDINGMTIGFSGRIYNGEKDSKYVNSKESPIFKKGLLLYNYHRAIEYSREEKQIIVVEGFMDVIRLYSVGIKNVVATMGTAITKEHTNLIKRLSKNVVLCFDGDKAGEKATVSAINEFEKVGITPKIIRLPNDLDPDDYIKKNGKDAFLNHLNNSMTLLEFKLDINKNNTDFNDYKDISNYIRSLVGDLEKIEDKIVYELTIKRIAKETNVDIDTINELVNNIPKENKIIIDKPKVIDNKNKYLKAEKYLVYYMLKDEQAIILYQNNVSYIKDRILSDLAIKILDFYDKNHYINLTDFIVYLEDNQELINTVIELDNLDLPPMNIESVKEYIDTIEKGLIKTEIEKIKDKLKYETNQAEKIILLEKLANLKKKECK